MQQAIEQKILSRIYGNGRGWAFSQADFADPRCIAGSAKASFEGSFAASTTTLDTVNAFWTY